MAEDWDLEAVVRSCSSSVATGSSITTTATTTITTNNTFCNHNNNSSFERPMSSLGSITFDQNENPFCFPDLMFDTRSTNIDPFEELQQLYKPFFSNHQNHQALIKTHCQINPLHSISILGGFNEQQQQKPHHQQLNQRLPQNQQQFQNSRIASNRSISTAQSQTPRSKKRKNQQKRVVCHLTAENLTNDMWAWRKYGQKPIKGSPYPRNYYRCSSSKGCGARKQVERSHTDPDMFIVTYTGEHIHPRPTHRNSLAGSTRNKLPGASQNPVPGEGETTVVTKSNILCASSSSPTSLSPTTPLTAAMEEEIAQRKRVEDDEMVEDENDVDDDENDGDGDGVDGDDDDDILIPNMVLNEDLFMGFEELGKSSPAANWGGGSAAGNAVFGRG
ncbi:WRKY domain [Dillenia turbinata]|uniref:WRKY domain n=1 Tax=Dillenia turbinata TaxID=194707 RepID=A0AAN8VVC9_9MAGN